MTDRVFKTVGDWALAADSLQWMLMRQRTRKAGLYWTPVSFVRSTKDILARCMREKGVDESTARLLLDGLPPSFDEWKSSQLSSQGEITQENPQENLPG